MKNRGLIGLLVTLIVGLAILASLWYGSSQQDKNGFVGNILHSLNSNSTSTTSSTTTVTKIASSSTSIDTTGWKTYANTEYAFEFKYPKEWYQQEIGVDGGDDPYRFGIFQTDQSPNIPKNGLYGPSISFWVSDLVIGSSNTKVTKDEFVSEVVKDRTYKWTKINGLDALRTERSNKTLEINNTIIDYYIFKGNKVYQLDFMHDNNNSTLNKYLEQFETIVSTFKFTN